jgi:hypothetical protein
VGVNDGAHLLVEPIDCPLAFSVGASEPVGKWRRARVGRGTRK